MTTNIHDLPDWWAHAVTQSMQQYDKGDADFSVSELIDAPHRRLLHRAHPAEAEERDVSDLTDLFIGNAVHAHVEKHQHGQAIHESRLFLDVEVGGQTYVVSGQADVLEPDALTVIDATLWDVKTCKNYAVKMVREGRKHDWEAQGNIYAEMWRHIEGARIDAVKFLAVQKDWNWREAETQKDYPPSNPLVLDLPVWSSEKCWQWLRDRIRLHVQAEQDWAAGLDVPICTPEERWQRPGDWAVIPEGSERAYRRFVVGEHPEPEQAARAKAEEMNTKPVKGKAKRKLYGVRFRAGEDVRCRPRFCAACRHCSYWRTLT